MARWTKKLIAKQIEWTDNAFRDALHELYGKYLSEAEKEMDLLDLKRLIELDWREEVRTPESNALYIRNLKRLPTEQIELIIEAFQKGKQYRSGATIEHLMTELFERSAIPETRNEHE